ncbi:U-box domain-containing protein 44-like protein [Tanacetum coccineum]|uniref:U-box domain-containing protein 44-like protein n=1 Tax=Tanacetum coccineum TaxID=301880 RepID=A0ABQ5DN02_9ASTR
MNLALSLNLCESDHGEVPFLESEEDVFKSFSLISLNGPNVQQNVLTEGSNGSKGLEISSIQVLVQLCEHENQNVRSNVVKLFSTLIKDGDDETFIEHVGVKCIETLVKIIKTSDDIEESVAAMEIISNLPKDPQMTRGILDAGALQVIISILSNRF